MFVFVFVIVMVFMVEFFCFLMMVGMLLKFLCCNVLECDWCSK